MEKQDFYKKAGEKMNIDNYNLITTFLHRVTYKDVQKRMTTPDGDQTEQTLHAIQSLLDELSAGKVIIPKRGSYEQH